MVGWHDPGGTAGPRRRVHAFARQFSIRLVWCRLPAFAGLAPALGHDGAHTVPDADPRRFRLVAVIDTSDSIARTAPAATPNRLTDGNGCSGHGSSPAQFFSTIANDSVTVRMNGEACPFRVSGEYCH